jgi:hypothetical protein
MGRRSHGRHRRQLTRTLSVNTACCRGFDGVLWRGRWSQSLKISETLSSASPMMPSAASNCPMSAVRALTHNSLPTYRLPQQTGHEFKPVRQPSTQHSKPDLFWSGSQTLFLQVPGTNHRSQKGVVSMYDTLNLRRGGSTLRRAGHHKEVRRERRAY